MFGTHRRSQLAAAMTNVNVAVVLVKQSEKIKLLGATLDNKLALTGHVNAVCKATFFHIRALRDIRSVLTEVWSAYQVFPLVPGWPSCEESISLTSTMFARYLSSVSARPRLAIL